MNSISQLTPPTLLGLPRELLIMIGKELSVPRAALFGAVAKKLHAIAPQMQLRSPEQASQMVERLVKAADFPTLQRWIHAANAGSKINVRIAHDTPEPTLQLLEGRFGTNLTLTVPYIDFEKIQKISTSCPAARLALDFSGWKPAPTVKVEAIVEEINRVFHEIANIKEVNIDGLYVLRKVLHSIKWPANLESLSCRQVAVSAILPHLPTTIVKFVSDYGELTDSDLAVVSTWTHLQELDLSQSFNITGQSFSSLPLSLVTLKCKGCRLTDAGIAQLWHLKNLQELEFGYLWRVKSETFAHLPPSLLKFVCTAYNPTCTLTDAAIAHLSHLTQLREINVGWNYEITEKSFQHLSTTLEKITCDACKVTDLAAFSRFTKLRELDIGQTKVQGMSFASLPPTLIKLRCYDCKLTDASLPYLGHLKQLQELNLDCNFKLEGHTLATLPISLTKLDCNNCKLTDETVANMASLRQLEVLCLCIIDSLKGTTLASLPNSLVRLSCKVTNIPEEAYTCLRQRKWPPRIINKIPMPTL